MQLQKHSERTGGLGISRSDLETDLCHYKDIPNGLEGLVLIDFIAEGWEERFKSGDKKIKKQMKKQKR